MTGRNDRAASGLAREGGRRLPDMVTVKCPPGTKDAIRRAAEAEGMYHPDWLRRLIRRGLEASRKRVARKGGSK